MQAVYHKGHHFVPEEHARQDPASVPGVIAAWVKALQSLEQGQAIQQALLHLLNTRPPHTQPQPAQVLPSIRCLLSTQLSQMSDLAPGGHDGGR